MLLHQLSGETVMPRRHGSMRGEHHLASHWHGGAIEIESFILHAMTNSLENCKAAMPFIQVQDAGI